MDKQLEIAARQALDTLIALRDFGQVAAVQTPNGLICVYDAIRKLIAILEWGSYSQKQRTAAANELKELLNLNDEEDDELHTADSVGVSDI